MKIKLIQYFVGNDPKYLQLQKATEEINKRYCSLYNYSYQIEYIDEDKVKKYYGVCNYATIIGYKVKFIQDQLKKQDADYLVLLDADAAISKPQIKIEELIDDTHSLFLSRGNDRWLQLYLANNLYKVLGHILNNNILKEQYYDEDVMKQYNMFNYGDRLSYGTYMFNQGFFIIKNTPQMNEFFTECYKNQQILMQIPYSKMPLDGRSIAFTLLYQKYNSIYKFLYPQAQGGSYNSFETKYNLETTFVLHNFGSGMNIDQKITAIKNLSTNKHWLNIKFI